MAQVKKPKNLIPQHKKSTHYGKNGKWKMDKPSTDGYEDVSEYASEHPEYVFHSTEHPKDAINPKTGKPFKYQNKYVGIHDSKFGKDLGASVYNAMGKGGSVVRVGERKIK